MILARHCSPNFKIFFYPHIVVPEPSQKGSFSEISTIQPSNSYKWYVPSVVGYILQSLPVSNYPTNQFYCSWYIPIVVACQLFTNHHLTNQPSHHPSNQPSDLCCRRLPLRQRDRGTGLCWGRWLGHSGARQGVHHGWLLTPQWVSKGQEWWSKVSRKLSRLLVA